MLKKSLLAVLLVGPAVSGCATIVDGRYQEVTILSEPTGAEVVTEYGTSLGTTPLAVSLSRKDAGNLVLKYPGIEDTQFTPGKRANGWIWGNLFLGLVPGFIVDAATGAATSFDQPQYVVDLGIDSAGNSVWNPGAADYSAEPGQLTRADISDFIRANNARFQADLMAGEGNALSAFYHLIGSHADDHANAYGLASRALSQSHSSDHFRYQMMDAFVRYTPTAEPAEAKPSDDHLRARR